MRIVVDLQAAQTPQSRNRGIGRYSIALAKAMLRHARGHDIVLALNGAFADTIEPLRDSFAGLLPEDAIRVWHPTLPPLPANSAAQRRAVQRVRQAFLASLRPDVVHVASMFEHSPLAATDSTPGARWRTAVTLYDLIPHVYPHLYLPSPGARGNYEEKIGHLRQVDLWLAISESSRQEGIERLQLPGGRVVNISSAADSHFTPQPLAREREADLRGRFGLPRPFTMYTGGIDHRKNIDGLIAAWAALPGAVRQQHQLAVVCSVQQDERDRLLGLARGHGLTGNELVLTGFVAEEDLVDLYRLCKLFVFPSRHEGFGLPALEAMSCGAAVIGANNSSIPEVIGRADALFDADSQSAITSMMLDYLSDDERRAALARHGLVQARSFSWDESARRALDAIEQLGADAGQAPRAARPAPPQPARPRLAYVSPLPPEHTGIADYSAELLPALARHYDVDVIVDQREVKGLPAGSFSAQRSAKWFLENGAAYQRVLYHFGNSAFHDYMLPLLERHPGVVVLHDFFLSGLMAHRELSGQRGPLWTRALYESHGWHAVAQRFRASRLEEVIYAFPANIEVLRNALGVIVHSPYSVELARQWYGPQAGRDWVHIPHLRVPLPLDRDGARARLGLAPDDFLVCSFGLLGPTKLNDRLLRAWRASALAADPRCRLVFVGENHKGDYGKALAAEIAQTGGRVRITGWAGTETFREYLNAADVAVQLRTLSRGETSGTVLDAMNHGVPLIANANGSMAYLPREAAMVLDEDFSDEQMVQSLERLWREPALRTSMGQAGRRIIESRHSPADCASSYAGAIEELSARADDGELHIAGQVGEMLAHEAQEPLSSALAAALDRNLPPTLRPARQLVVDVSAWARQSLPEQRLPMPALLRELLERPLAGWRAEPACRCTDGEWRYASAYVLAELGCPPQAVADELLDLRSGDLWCSMAEGDAAGTPPEVAELSLDALRLPPQGDAALAWAVINAAASPHGRRQWFVDVSELVRRDWQSGVQRVVKNYLLELLRSPPDDVRVVPVYASPGVTGYRIAGRFLLGLAGLEGALSADPPMQARAGDLFFGLDLQPGIVAEQAPVLRELRTRGVRVAFMVYDLLPLRLPDCFYPSGAPDHERWLRVVAESDLAVCISRAVADDLALWMHEQRDHAAGPGPRIEAVHLGADLMHAMPSEGLPPEAEGVLTRIGQRPSFLMVGTLEPRKRQAAVLEAFERLWSDGHDVGLVIVGREGWMSDVLVATLSAHPEIGKRLFWMGDASDEYVERIYRACTCLLLASRGEGFGLPLIEAAQRGLPIIARDLPVFREVAGEHAYYFRDDSPGALAGTLLAWLELQRQGRQPASSGVKWQTWAQSAAQLRQLMQQSGGDQAG